MSEAIRTVTSTILLAVLGIMCLSGLLLTRLNILRKLGDASQLVAIALLILQLVKAKNARGISVRTQELRLTVFMTRYLDLFTSYFGPYNTIMKLVLISATMYIIILIKYTEPYKTLYNPSQDSFPHWKFAVLPCVVLSFFVHMIGSKLDGFSFIEWAWTFSIMLESVAIIPQLVVLRKYRLVENLTGKFVFFLGVYRVFYALNWIYQVNTHMFVRHRPLMYICGFIQTALYLDFFYQYCRISRLTRHCKGDPTTDDNEDDEEMDGLLFESEREMVNTGFTAQSLLSNTDHSLSLRNEPSASADAQQRRQSTQEDQ
ncbi:ER lumen protein retaining receptor [Nitzschia inconspicua]|uniref:ER lumen protein retaining receptor n=1 Tax=Nitzschia inconspicua TaxID=303405 RepID=A0A9K3PY73_9STRA|nr:ER lumen protein retaining receptor [Nitzschia inconspicua]